jgi:hypothetical protein
MLELFFHFRVLIFHFRLILTVCGYWYMLYNVLIVQIDFKFSPKPIVSSITKDLVSQVSTFLLSTS